MDRWMGRVALVTGASVGIGAAIVKNLTGHGVKVVTCARNINQLQAQKDELKDNPGSIHPIKCDLTKEEEILALFKQVKDSPDLVGVDICVNNAGCALHNASLLGGETHMWRSMLEVNVLGASICTREAVRSMKERGVDDGQIIYVSSMSGHRVTSSPMTHFYGATKFAVTALMEGVRNELRQMKSHIRVSGISPGIVETEFFYRLHVQNPEKAKQVYSGIQCLQAKDIADHVEFILRTPPHVQIHDILLRATDQVL